MTQKILNPVGHPGARFASTLSPLYGGECVVPDIFHASHGALGAGSRLQPALDPKLVNDPGLVAIAPRASSEAALRAQILLARAHFSCGEIDGIYGEKMRKTAASFQQRHSLRADGTITHATWEQLNGDGEPALIFYTLTPEDVAGPFQKTPEDIMEKAKLPALSYESPLEGIAEKFHTSPALLTRLNPESTFDRVGEELWVPNVFAPPPGKAALVVIDGSAFTVTTLDSQGQIMTHYPTKSSLLLCSPRSLCRRAPGRSIGQARPVHRLRRNERQCAL